MKKWKDDTPIEPTLWNRKKGLILGSLAAVAIATVVVQRVGLRQHNRYLEEKGLLDDFYHSED